MAKVSSPRSTGKLKQRVVGTVVLVALFIIIVLILPSRDDGGAEVLEMVEIPPKPTNFNVKVLPIKVPESPRKPKIILQQAVRLAQDEPNPGAKSGLEPAATQKLVKKPAVKIANDAKAKTPTVSVAQEWVIQVGSFSTKENAAGLHDRLKADNYKVFVKEVKSSSGSSYRVLIGPNADRAKLEPFKVKLENLLDAPALIKAYETK